MSDPALHLPAIEAETPFDAAAVDAVVDAAFGPGRYAKTAERLREGSTAICGFVAREGRRVAGSVRLWPITIGGTPAAFLGPIAVDATGRRSGLGAALVTRACDCAAEQGLGVLVVGDLPYFGRFGFAPAPEARLPGPVDQRRVLWRGQGDTPTGNVMAAPETR